MHNTVTQFCSLQYHKKAITYQIHPVRFLKDLRIYSRQISCNLMWWTSATHRNNRHICSGLATWTDIMTRTVIRSEGVLVLMIFLSSSQASGMTLLNICSHCAVMFICAVDVSRYSSEDTWVALLHKNGLSTLLLLAPWQNRRQDNVPFSHPEGKRSHS